jgi:acetyl esterase
MARDGDLPRPCLQLLIYPSLDLSSTQDSYQRVVEGFPLTTTTMRWFRNAYIRNEADIVDWHASPLRAPHLDGLCPAFVLTAAHDPLCDEAFEYVRRLTGAGVPVSHLHMNDQMHGFLTMGRIVRAAQFATEACAAALQGAWRRN